MLCDPLQILPKEQSGSGTRARRGSGRAGRDIILNKVKKELDVLQRCARHLHACSRTGPACDTIWDWLGVLLLVGRTCGL